jgi:hypothetical protein
MARTPVENYLATLNDAIPSGDVVVHNRVRPSMRVRLGSRGFRAWHQKLDDTIAVCRCGWGPKFGTHYIAKAEQLQLAL